MKDYTLTLKNGQIVGILELGNENSKNVIFFNHGFPGCRYDSTLFKDCLNGKDVRLIALERSGYGNSSYIKDRTILDFTNEFSEVLDTLQIERCKIIGISGGTPYALACAAKLQDRIEKVAIISGVSEIEDNAVFEGMTASNKIFLKLGRFSPALVKPLAELISFLWSCNVNNMFTWMKLFMSKADKALLNIPENEKMVKNVLTESLKQGGRGIVQDFILLCKRWGFSPSEIKVPVHFWHGDEDCYVTLAMAKKNASFIQQAEFSVVPNAGHLAVVHIADDVIDYLSC
jgi:pimeloyl-ACP methyl ester carboxylesterase